MEEKTTQKAVFYRKEQLPEITSSVILKCKLGASIYEVPNGKAPLLEDAKEKSSIVYGSYYNEQSLELLAGISKGVVVHLYKTDAEGRYTNLLGQKDVAFSVEPVDSKVNSYIGFTWNTYVKEEMPRVVKLLDEKGMAKYDGDPDTKPLIEWVYVTGVNCKVLEDLIFGENTDLEECLRQGRLFVKKSDSLVGSICDAAGWYTLFEKSYKTAIVDATRGIELVGEELCKRGADIAVIARFDHAAKKYRYTLYTCNSSIIAVQVAKNAGYDAGGGHKSSGFLSDQSVSAFIANNEVKTCTFS